VTRQTKVEDALPGVPRNLFAVPLGRADVIEYVQADESLGDQVRVKALERVARFREVTDSEAMTAPAVRWADSGT
jgi:hypothetical protein